MQRMFLPLVIAVLIHAIVLTADTAWLVDSSTIAPQTQVITMQLIERTPYRPPAIRSLPKAPPRLPPIQKKTGLKNLAPKKQTARLKAVAPKPRPVVKSPPDKRLSPPRPASPAALQAAAESDPKPDEPPSTFNSVRTTADHARLHPDSEPPTRVKAATTPGNKQTHMTAVVAATPRYHENPPPDYPAIARKRGYEGTVVLEVFVKEDGTVGNLRIVQSSRHRLLDRSAVNAVKQWQFEPGWQADQALAMWVRVPVNFRLQ